MVQRRTEITEIMSHIMDGEWFMKTSRHGPYWLILFVYCSVWFKNSRSACRLLNVKGMWLALDCTLTVDSKPRAEAVSRLLSSGQWPPIHQSNLMSFMKNKKTLESFLGTFSTTHAGAWKRYGKRGMTHAGAWKGYGKRGMTHAGAWKGYGKGV